MININEYHKNTFVNEIEILVNTVRDKLLAPLSEDALTANAPNLSTEDDVYEYIIPYLEIKNDLINMSAVWLYHLFEKNYDEISLIKNPQNSVAWTQRRNELTNFNVNINQGSNFASVQDELRLLANAYKHGKHSKSTKALHKILPSMCISRPISNFSGQNNRINYEIKDFSPEQLQYYAERMKAFWSEVYDATR
jgi:hypothetical protein